MLYFVPTGAYYENCLPVPFTAPVKVGLESRWVNPSDAPRGYYKYWAYVSLHGISIWGDESYNEEDLKARLNIIKARIANLASRDIQGVIDLSNTPM